MSNADIPQCVMCRSCPVGVIVLPCGHECLCVHCAAVFMAKTEEGPDCKCPLCRAGINYTRPVCDTLGKGGWVPLSLIAHPFQHNQPGACRICQFTSPVWTWTNRHLCKNSMFKHGWVWLKQACHEHLCILGATEHAVANRGGVTCLRKRLSQRRPWL